MSTTFTSPALPLSLEDFCTDGAGCSDLAVAVTDPFAFGVSTRLAGLRLCWAVLALDGLGELRDSLRAGHAPRELERQPGPLVG